MDDPASAPWWDQLDADVGADTWRQINLVVTNDQGSRSEVDLLRPVSWLSAHQANVGGRIYLSMPEMGIEGYGEVISIGNSPEIASGPGCVVTGRFRHVSDDVLSVRLSDQSAVLGVTAQHPVYSLDRGDFVAAGELSAGERLATLAGPTAVLGIQPQHTAGQHTPQTVYNLEVQGQHVFRVTSNGLLVHNSYGNAPRGNQGAPIESLLRGNMKQTTGRGFSTAQKGALGEARTSLTMRRAGFDELPARLPGNQGFDGIWVKRGADGGILDIVITESKYASSGKLRLTNTATMGRQLSPQWIDANIRRMLQQHMIHAVRASLGMLLQANRNRWLVGPKAAVINPSRSSDDSNRTCKNTLGTKLSGGIELI